MRIDRETEENIEKIKNDGKHILQYIFNKKGKKCGVMIATNLADGFRIGASICNTKKDLFDKKWGETLAWIRIVKDSGFPIPNYAMKQVSVFVNRSQKYFKGLKEI